MGLIIFIQADLVLIDIKGTACIRIDFKIVKSKSFPFLEKNVSPRAFAEDIAFADLVRQVS